MPSQRTSLLEYCDAHKFETMVEVQHRRGPPQFELKFCGNEGQSDADWIHTLKDAVEKTKTNLADAEGDARSDRRAINAEIARRRGTPGASVTVPPPRQTIAKPAAPDYAPLPPRPTAAGTIQGSREGSAGLPPLPKPRISFICFNPSDVGEGPCTGFERDTMLTVRADEDLPAGTSIRFVRDGDAKADVQLAQLQRGKSMRFSLPSDVCSHWGAAPSRFASCAAPTGPSGQVVGKDGPYNLRC